MEKNKFNKTEIDEFVDVLEKYKKQVTKNPESSRKFLIDLGVITKGGNLNSNYKKLCIQERQV